MNSDLCIGIASKDGTLEVAAHESGKAMLVMKFPATSMGVEAIKVFLASYERSMRLAVAGVAALSLALAFGNISGRETFIVASRGADTAAALVNYAERMS